VAVSIAGSASAPTTDPIEPPMKRKSITPVQGACPIQPGQNPQTNRISQAGCCHWLSRDPIGNSCGPVF